MKSLTPLFTVVFLFFTFLLPAQTYEVRDWNRKVSTYIKNKKLRAPGERFTNYNQISFRGANKADGWVVAINLGNSSEGAVIRGCSTADCVPYVQIVVAGPKKNLHIISIDEFLLLADQQSPLQQIQQVKPEQMQQVKPEQVQQVKTEQVKPQETTANKPNAAKNKQQTKTRQ